MNMYDRDSHDQELSPSGSAAMRGSTISTSAQWPQLRLRRWGSWVGIAALFSLVVAVVLAVFAQPARAQEVPGAITSLSTTASHVGQWDQVDFDCTWAVPDGSSPGDTFTLQLPPALRWYGSTQFALKAPDGQVVATATVGGSGAVVFTLTDYVALHPVNLHGTCAFSTQYTVETTGGDVTVAFKVSSQVIPVTIRTSQPCVTNCVPDRTTSTKGMWWLDSAQTHTRSVLRAPAATGASNDVVITDTPGPGQQLDCSSIEATIGKTLDSSGNVTAPRDDATHPPVIACTGTEATVTWTGVPAGEYTEVRVDGVIVDPALAEYDNSGTVVINGHQTPVQAVVRRSDASGTGVGASATTTAPPASTTTTTAPSSTTTTAPPTSTTTTAPSSTTTTAAPASTASTTAPGSVAVTGTKPTSSTGLAFTGTDLVGPALLGLGASILGVLLIWTARRRRSAEE